MNTDRESDPPMRLFIVHHKGWGDFFALVQAASTEEALRLAQKKCRVVIYERDVRELSGSAEPCVLWNHEEDSPDSER